MSAIPSPLFVRLGLAAVLASSLVLIVPEVWPGLLIIDLLLTMAAAVDWFLTPKPSLVHAERRTADRMSVLGEQTVALVARNRSQVALRVHLQDTVPQPLGTDDADHRGWVPAQGQRRWQYQVQPTARGRFCWGPLYLAYRSVLGLWERRKVITAPGEVRVYPNLSMLTRYHILAHSNRLDALGIRRERLRRGAWEFESLRDYVPGDDVRLIDWKATARRSKPIFKNHEAERNQTILILVDCGRLMQATVDGVSKLDHAVNTALVLAHVALSRGDRVGLCTFSHRVHAWVAPRAHVAQNRLLTDALFDLRGDFTESDHGRCLRLLAARHSKRALLVVLTDFVDAETASEMVAHLQLAARRHLVLFAAMGDPFLKRAARSHPTRTFDGFRKAAAIDLLHDRREVLERLRQAGAHVIDTEPADLTAPVINRYLQIALRGLL